MENYYGYFARDDFYSDQEDIKNTYETFMESLDIDLGVFGDEYEKDNLSEAEKVEAKRQLNSAYETLSNPQKKQQYDLDLLSDKHPEGFNDTFGYYVPGENFIHLNPDFFVGVDHIRRFSVPSQEKTKISDKTLVKNNPDNKASTNVSLTRDNIIATMPPRNPASKQQTVSRLYTNPVIMGEKYNRSTKSKKTIFGIVVLAALFLWTCVTDTGKTNSKSSNNSQGIDYASVVKEEIDSDLQEIKVGNGEILIRPHGECLAPFEVKTKSSDKSNYFIYLKCINDSNNDIAFYVKGGDTAEVAVPLGRYKLFYCSGKTWYGYNKKFGSRTAYAKADDTFEFYDDGQYYQGHTITLYEVVDGNMDTDEIDASQFPG